MTQSLLILGAGGHGHVVADAARAAGVGKIAFLDDEKIESRFAHFPVIGRLSDLSKFAREWRCGIAAVGDNRLRRDLLSALLIAGYETPAVVHSAAVISPDAEVGHGVFAAAGCVVNIGTRLGEGAIVNTGATIDHDCLIGDGVHVSPGAHLAGNVTVMKDAWIGIGASVRNGISIGERAMVGAGSAVIHDVEEGAAVVGIPARPLSNRQG